MKHPDFYTEHAMPTPCEDMKIETFASVSWTVDDVIRAAEKQGITCTFTQGYHFLSAINELIMIHVIKAGFDVIRGNMKILEKIKKEID